MSASARGSGVGQLVVVGLDRPVLPERTRRLIRERGLGGVFLYGEALGPEEATVALTREVQKAGAPVPLFVAVDQEGGVLQEWGPPHRQPLPAPAQVGDDFRRTGDLQAVRALGRRIAGELRAGGINLDFAPVLDVNTNPGNPIIGSRSFGADPELVSLVGREIVRGLHDGSVLACGKHFPGHGDTALDSHKTLPVVAHDRRHLDSTELRPFRDAIADGLQVIMTAHVLYPTLDPERPATLSPAILGGLLRDELGFDGLVVTDDLKMQGIRDRHDLLEASLAALAAGCDLLLTATEQDRHEMLLEALEEARRDGRLSSRRLAESLHRIERVKARWLGAP